MHEGGTGLLVPPLDSGALSQALLRLLRDPDLARQIAANGRLAIQEFSFERLVREVECRLHRTSEAA